MEDLALPRTARVREFESHEVRVSRPVNCNKASLKLYIVLRVFSRFSWRS